MDRYVRNDNPKYKTLISVLGVGEKNARSMNELSRYFSMSCREVRKMVECARIDGVIICSSDAGYFVPSCEDELIAYYRRTMYRIKTTRSTLVPVEKHLKGGDCDED